MNEPTNDNDIDALLRYLLTSGHTQHWNDDSTRWRAALTALVAERNNLRQIVAIGERQLRLAKAEANDRDRDLRERLLESALRGVNVSGLHRSEAELIGKASVWMVDAAIAAMRKEEA